MIIVIVSKTEMRMPSVVLNNDILIYMSIISSHITSFFILLCHAI